MAGGQSSLIACEFISGMQGQFQAWDLLAQHGACLIHRTTEMAIHRHNDDAGG
jgi:hypothetical protein